MHTYVHGIVYFQTNGLMYATIPGLMRTAVITLKENVCVYRDRSIAACGRALYVTATQKGIMPVHTRCQYAVCGNYTLDGYLSGKCNYRLVLRTK
jgi:hypothetical protein